MLKLIVDRTQTLKEFTENNYAQASFFWRTLLKNKEIKVNGKKVDKDTIVNQGDEISYFLTPKQAQKPSFYIVEQDENIIVVDKESGVNSEAVFAQLQRDVPNCRFIHRLDRNTTGLLVFALNEPTELALKRAFKERKVEKIYHALCFGKFPKERDILTAYLKKNGEQSLVTIYPTERFGAEEIITEYEILEIKEDMTKVKVILHTGKTHQIRAHLAYIGCPIVGDMKYGDTAKNKQKSLTRQCLVAKILRFDLDGEYAYLNTKEFVSRFELDDKGVNSK